MKQILWILAGILFCLFMFFIGIPFTYIELQKTKTNPDQEYDFPLFIPDAEPLIERDLTVIKTVSAAELNEAYVSDIVKAQQNFDDQLVRISGTVLSNETVPYNTHVIKLDSGNSFWPIIIRWDDEYEPWAASVGKGAIADWICFANPKGGAHNKIILRHCSPVKV